MKSLCNGNEDGEGENVAPLEFPVECTDSGTEVSPTKESRLSYGSNGYEGEEGENEAPLEFCVECTASGTEVSPAKGSRLSYGFGIGDE